MVSAMHDTATGASAATDRTADGRLVYKPAEVASKLGVSQRYVYVLIKQGDLKTVTLANRLMVLADDLNVFIESLRAEREQVRTEGGAA